MTKITNKVMLILFMSLLLFLSLAPVSYANKSGDAIVNVKDEVIYANLTEKGKLEHVYVVNIFDVSKAGSVTDYGLYSELKNLTDLSELEQSADEITFLTEVGKFYYQGDFDNAELPWYFNITYRLNGRQIAPDEILGENGKVDIQIEINRNKASDVTFFENYMLQISADLAMDRFTNVVAKDGMFANVGEKKQVNFTVMPEEERVFHITADVIDFEFDGFVISGIPSSLAIDSPETDEMESEMTSLSDAVEKLHNGIGELKAGVNELHVGANELQKGSNQFHDGVNELSGSSNVLLAGSTEIKQALAQISGNLNHVEDIDFSDLNQLKMGLLEVAKGLREVANGMQQLQGGYDNAWGALATSIQSIPQAGLSDADIAALYASNANQTTIDHLVKNYQAAQVVKGTYTQTKQVFDMVTSSLNQSRTALLEMAKQLEGAAKQIEVPNIGFGDLISGLKKLSTEYKDFHGGLSEYASGVELLAKSYDEMNKGINELANGTTELNNGVSELHQGSAKLAKATKQLPDKLTEQIDEMLAQFDKTDYEAISFVSDKNEQIGVVQFVMSTKEIKRDKDETEEEPKKEKKGFWQLLKELFIFN